MNSVYPQNFSPHRTFALISVRSIVFLSAPRRTLVKIRRTCLTFLGYTAYVICMCLTKLLLTEAVLCAYITSSSPHAYSTRYALTDMPGPWNVNLMPFHQNIGFSEREILKGIRIN